jgi:PAS domain-containing protein
MADTTIDYRAIFWIMPGALALLTPEGVIVDVNEGYLEASGRTLEELVGRDLFEMFPESPADPGKSGPDQLRTSLREVAASGQPDFMPPIRYDVEDPARPGEFEVRYWTVINKPIWGADGRVTMIVHRAEEITHIVNQTSNLIAGQG